jgi:hypothetical protein
MIFVLPLNFSTNQTMAHGYRFIGTRVGIALKLHVYMIISIKLMSKQERLKTRNKTCAKMLFSTILYIFSNEKLIFYYKNWLSRPISAEFCLIILQFSNFFSHTRSVFPSLVFRPSRFPLLCPFVVVSFPFPYIAIGCDLWWDLLRRRGIPGWVLCPLLQNGWLWYIQCVSGLWQPARHRFGVCVHYMVWFALFHFSCCSCSCFSFIHFIKSCGGYVSVWWISSFSASFSASSAVSFPGIPTWFGTHRNVILIDAWSSFRINWVFGFLDIFLLLLCWALK